MSVNYNPYNYTNSENIKNFVSALNQFNASMVRVFTIESKYLPKNMIISNRSLLELATNFTNFECWMIIYNYIGADIKLAPKGIYMFDYIAESGKNPDPKIFEFLINLDLSYKRESAGLALSNSISSAKYDTMLAILNSNIANVSMGLHTAVLATNKDIVGLLLKHGGQLEYENNNLDVITFALLRDQPHPLIYARLPDNSNGLYVALYNNNEQEIIQCFNNDIMKSFTYKLLPHPVLCAAQYSNLNCIKLIINLYDNYSMKNLRGRSMNKRLAGNENILNMVVKRPFDEEIYTYIINLNIDKNNVSNDRTPLSYVVREGDLVKAKFLLDNGCNPNIITSEGTCLMECIYCCYSANNLSMMKLLLSYGADYNLKYPDTQEYVPYRGISALDLCLLLNKPDLRLI